ncbi:DUF2269 family protein [Phytopseudomonas dryadis]|uniref:DUF2269 domain-containing protein n=1 Tax=Phytopseudomonas dryadis TaxID=2487520 RepID=A0A4Q9R257_9GAMM|nr:MULTISPECIES: DUF2269 family protein [Pseudomonas]TBU92547.1 DUF2269 domain-containing protein [Pseudomonas dryadis]TBV03039.1 DUF2269 domain-containing protein [Pseudomonas dryadis]TBV17684.1 DUF2269 domain-containing protein [Pseudomonas sp. FRB 230]
MEHYLLLRIAHSLPGILLLLGVAAHAFMLWKAWRGGDAALLQRKLRRTRRISLPVFAVLALSLPLTGWWMVELAGWPLGLTWLLAGSVLYGVMMVLGLLLVGRLNAWQALGETPAPVRLLRFSAAYAGLIVLLLLVIMALMGAKPA